VKITIEHYGKTYTMEWRSDDVPLVSVIHALCLMLFSLGWSQEQIIECFNSDDPDVKNNPFDWEVRE
jgi:hypothetical protein